jgi:hypothetical protein
MGSQIEHLPICSLTHQNGAILHVMLLISMQFMSSNFLVCIHYHTQTQANSYLYMHQVANYNSIYCEYDFTWMTIFKQVQQSQ